MRDLGRILIVVAAAACVSANAAQPVPGDAACIWGPLNIVQRAAFSAGIVLVHPDGSERAATPLERNQLTCKGAVLEKVFSDGADKVAPVEVRFEF